MGSRKPCPMPSHNEVICYAFCAISTQNLGGMSLAIQTFPGHGEAPSAIVTGARSCSSSFSSSPPGERQQQQRAASDQSACSRWKASSSAYLAERSSTS